MLIYEKKQKKPVSLVDPTTQQEGKECPQCGYVRSIADLAPDWQCPSCEVAYSKVSQEYLDHQRKQQRDEILRLREESLLDQRGTKIERHAGLVASMGAALGAAGVGSGCGIAPAVSGSNPWLIGAGALAMLGSAIYWLRNRPPK